MYEWRYIPFPALFPTDVLSHAYSQQPLKVPNHDADKFLSISPIAHSKRTLCLYQNEWYENRNRSHKCPTIHYSHIHWKQAGINVASPYSKARDGLPHTPVRTSHSLRLYSSQYLSSQLSYRSHQEQGFPNIPSGNHRYDSLPG